MMMKYSKDREADIEQDELESDDGFPTGASLPPLPEGWNSDDAWENRVVGPDGPFLHRIYIVNSAPEAPIEFVSGDNDAAKKMSGLLRLRVLRLARAIQTHIWPSGRPFKLKVLKSL